jgi:hypothetical protein
VSSSYFVVRADVLADVRAQEHRWISRFRSIVTSAPAGSVVAEAPLMLARHVGRADLGTLLPALRGTAFVSVPVLLTVPGLLLTAVLVPALGHDRLLGTVERWAEISLARGQEARISDNHHE